MALWRRCRRRQDTSLGEEVEAEGTRWGHGGYRKAESYEGASSCDAWCPFSVAWTSTLSPAHYHHRRRPPLVSAVAILPWLRRRREGEPPVLNQIWLILTFFLSFPLMMIVLRIESIRSGYMVPTVGGK